MVCSRAQVHLASARIEPSQRTATGGLASSEHPPHCVKIKLDENLPARLVRLLAELGHDADTVPQEGFTGRPDSDVWAAAQNAGRFLITQDLDFSDIRRFAPGMHHGLLLVRLRAPGRDALTRRVQAIFQTEPVETWKRSFVVLTDHKLRVVSPKGETGSADITILILTKKKVP